MICVGLGIIIMIEVKINFYLRIISILIKSWNMIFVDYVIKKSISIV